MRRLRKQGVAIVMAAMMMASGMQGSTGFIAPATVMAAAEESVYDNNTEQSLDIDFSALDSELWNDVGKKSIDYAYTNEDPFQVDKNFNMTAKIKIDQQAYESISTEGAYLKVKGVVSFKDWAYKDADVNNCFYLDKNNFSISDDGYYYADVDYGFKDTDGGEIWKVGFEVVGAKFKGTLNFKDVSIKNVKDDNKTETKDTEVYKSSEAKTVENIDYSSLEKEEWGENWKKTLQYAFLNNENYNVSSTYKVTSRVSISKEAYDSLSKDGSYLKIKSATKQNDWENYVGSDNCFELKQSDFKEDNGTYYADVTNNFADKLSGKVFEIDFEIVGVGFVGNVTFDNVAIYNVETSKPELTPTDPSVLADFATKSSMDSWDGEVGYQYYHGGTDNAKPILSYDADGQRLKVSLNYTANKTADWSEAKVKYYNEDGVDISNYNQASVDLIYSGENPIGKMKFFSNAGINKDCTVDTTDAEDLGNGLHKVTVTMGFSPTDKKLQDFTIGLIGVKSSFVGDVYLDNVKLSQKNATADFVEITKTPREGTTADISKAATNLKVTDAELADSALALQSYLNGLKNSDQVLFGHQNDVSRSVSARDELGDVHDVTGSVSGVFGIDTLSLNGSEGGGENAKDALEKAVASSKTAANNGAIVSLSAHMPNFTNSKIKKDADGNYDFYKCDFSESQDLSNDSLKTILPGGENNDVYNAYLDIIADYANQLAEDDIPVMFRPLHENTGSWFWWGSTNSEESFKSLYRYTRDYLENKGVHNMLYVYSPCGPITSEEDFMSRYPGDEYVDVLGFDYYADYTYGQDADDSYFTNLDSTCKVVSKIAKEHGKIAGISECGVRVTRANGSSDGLLVKGNPVAQEKSGYNWYQEVSNVAKKNDMPYYLVWANFSDTNFYVPYKYDDTYGQEMINEFIDYYNDSSSIFGKGTNFYNNIKTLATATKADKYDNTYGYITEPFDMDELTEDTTLSAYVKNADKVSFVVKDTATDKSITLDGKAQKAAVAAQSLDTTADVAGSTRYTATLTQVDMEKLGKTDVATITVVADGIEISTIKNLSIGKKKDVAPANVFEDFDYYAGSSSLLEAAYTQNSAAGCSSSFALSKDNKADGTYGGAFTYTLKTKGSEVWTGNIKSSLTNNNFSDYNALQMWVKPDGQGQKLVIQVTDGSGEEFEAYLTDFVKGTEAKYVSIPFSKFKGKLGGTLDPSNITKFAIWCNSIPANGATDITSTIYFDGIRAVKLTDDQLALSEQDAEYGLIVTDAAIGEPAINDGNQNGNKDDNDDNKDNNGGNQGDNKDNNGGNNGGSQVTTPSTQPSQPQAKTNTVKKNTTTKKATKTGDNRNILIWVAGCAAGAGLLGASRKKSKKTMR